MDRCVPSVGVSRKSVAIAKRIASHDTGAILRAGSMRKVVSGLSALAVLLVAQSAYADKVAMLSLGTGDTAAAQANVRDAVARLNHTLTSPSVVDAARLKVQDGTPDSSAEYLVVAKETSADWTLAGQVTKHEDGFRVELVACEAASGRVESLARNVSGSNAVEQLQEVLGYLLRREGIGSAAISWRIAPIAAPKVAPAVPPPAVVVTPPLPPQPPKPPAIPHDYAERHPIAPGAGIGFYGAIARPSNARGSSFSSSFELTFGYALPDALKGLEARGNIGFSIAGPSSLHLDVGARYAIGVVPSARIYAGPELTLGLFAPLGGDQTARFLVRGAGFVAVGIGPQVQLDVLAEIAAAPGGSGALVLAGGQVRGNVRF